MPGAYAAIYAELLWHRKVLALSEKDRLAAFGFYCACCAYCQLNRTDGFLANPQLVAVFPCTEVERTRYTSALIAVRLFDIAEGGIAVHDYLVHNASKEDIENGRRRMSEGGKKSPPKKSKTPPKVPSEGSFGRSTEQSRDVMSKGPSFLDADDLALAPEIDF